MAEPKADPNAKPSLFAAPLGVAPAVVTATSSQSFVRGYSAPLVAGPYLGSPYVAAPYAASSYIASPYVASSILV